MDFFEHQEIARKKTRVLIAYFCLAILGIIAAVYALAVGVMHFLGSSDSGNPVFWNPSVLLLSATGTGMRQARKDCSSPEAERSG